MNPIAAIRAGGRPSVAVQYIISGMNIANSTSDMEIDMNTFGEVVTNGSEVYCGGMGTWCLMETLKISKQEAATLHFNAHIADPGEIIITGGGDFIREDLLDYFYKADNVAIGMTVDFINLFDVPQEIIDMELPNWYMTTPDWESQMLLLDEWKHKLLNNGY